MNSCEFNEIIVFKGFEVENGVFGLELEIYLSIVKFLKSSVLRIKLTYVRLITIMKIYIFYHEVE
jgi:hypothetical protein